MANARCCPVDSISNISICARKINESSSASTTLDLVLDDQCTEGFSGPLCLVCAVGFVKQGDDCRKCPQGASISIAALPMIISLVILLAGLLVAFVCGKKVEKHAEDSGSKWFGQAKVSYSFYYK